MECMKDSFLDDEDVYLTDYLTVNGMRQKEELAEINDNIPEKEMGGNTLKRKKAPTEAETVELKENWDQMLIKDPPVIKKKRAPRKKTNQNMKRNFKTEETMAKNNQNNNCKKKPQKQKKVKLKFQPLKKIENGPLYSTGSLNELIPRTSNPDFTPNSSLYYSRQIINHFTAPSVSQRAFILNLSQPKSHVLINENC